MKLKLWICKKLYRHALRIVEINVKEQRKHDNYIDGYNKLDRLTYSDGENIYLFYGFDNEWQKICGRYEVIQKAINKLYMYEKKEYLKGRKTSN